jgi:hypothetical protein
MSDFLGNLAMKSLGLAPLVQPRPLSAFEALPAGGALSAATQRPPEPADLPTEVVSDERAEHPSTGSGRLGRSDTRASHETLSVPRAHGERPDKVQGVTVSMSPVEPQAEAPILAAITPAAVEEAPHGTSQAAPLPAPQRAPVPASSPATPPAGEAQRLVPQPTPVQTVAAPAREGQAEPPSPRRLLTPRVEQIRPGPAQAETKAVAAPAKSPAERAELATAPTISVTIGRVEVRAALTPRPSHEGKGERRAGLSLNDYLRLRSGGKP